MDTQKQAKPDYCVNDTTESCYTCSLVNYGLDCQNRPLNTDDEQ